MTERMCGFGLPSPRARSLARAVSRPPRPAALGVLRLLALPCLLAVLCLLPQRAAAQDPGVLFRFYYSSWMNGEIEHSPADTTGAYTDSNELSQDPKVELEAIFLQRIGLSFSRQKVDRRLDAAAGTVTGCSVNGCDVHEQILHESLNVTLYGRPVMHNQFNYFGGGGAGFMDYDFTVDGTRQSNGELFDNLSLSRWFWGFEYTFERIGFRLEFSRVNGRKTLAGASVDVAENFQYLSLVVPLN